MKLLTLLIPFFFLPFSTVNVEEALPTSRQTTLREISNDAFNKGEYLKYRIHYGIIDAGIAELSVKDITHKNGREVFHMVGKGRSTGMAEWFFKTRDTYESYIDTKSILPWEFVRDVNEGGYKIKRHVMFDHYNNTAKDILEKQPKDYQIPVNTQDILSAFYYARAAETEEMIPGDVLPIEIFMDHEVFPFQLKYMGVENMKTKWGHIACKRLVPVVQEGRVFREEEGLTLWVTDDANKIPIRLEAKLAVGSIKMDLDDYRNNRSPLQFKK